MLGGLVSMCWCVCVVLSCLVLSCLVLSCLVLSCLVLSCLVLSCLVLSCLVLCCCVFELLCVVSFKIKWSSAASSGKANDWRTLFSTSSQTLNGLEPRVSFCEPL